MIRPTCAVPGQSESDLCEVALPVMVNAMHAAPGTNDASFGHLGGDYKVSV
jgi:hypothetical protein